MTTGRVVAIVLAGGASTRFGSDKLAALLDGRPVLHHALDAVAGVADHVIVVVGPDVAPPAMSPSVVGRVSIARDPIERAGPLAGLAAGLRASSSMVAGSPLDIAIVVGGDMPALVPAVLQLLVMALEADRRLVAVTLEGPDAAPLPLAIRVSAAAVADEIVHTGPRRSLRALLEAVPSDVVPARSWRELDPEGRTLRDVDMPADL